MQARAPAGTSTAAWALPLLGTALAYVVAGLLALQLAIPPGYASPLWPAAGIALACVLRFGWPALAGVLIGSFAANELSTRAAHDLAAHLMHAAMAAGAALQAAAGAALARRFVRRPQSLLEAGDVLRFLALVAPLACVLSASVGVSSLLAAGALPLAQAPMNWVTWWAGDAFGVLIAAPVALALFGLPREDWAGRRVAVALPLVLVTLLLAMGIERVARTDATRTQGIFERDAAAATEALRRGLRDTLHALQAVRTVYIASFDVSREEFAQACTPWLTAMPHLQAMGFAQRVPKSRVAAFESEIAGSGLPQYRVFDRTDNGAAAAAQSDADAMAIRHIEPLAGNAGALGVNVLSIDAARAAALQAWRSGVPTATAAFGLTQSPTRERGIVVYHGVYAGAPSDDTERTAALQGVVFVTWRIEAAVRELAATLPPYLALCLHDESAEPGRQLLFGGAGCDAAPSGAGRPGDLLRHADTLEFAGRRWRLDASARAADVPSRSYWNAWLFAAVGLAATAMLGALLLTMTGRAQRVERAVRERTAALRHEIDERSRTEAALRESQQRLRNILDHVPIGVFYADLAGAVRESNPRLQELTGRGADELAGMTVADFTHPDDRAADAELRERLARGEIGVYRLRKRVVTREGREIWVQETVSLLRDPQERPHRIVGVVEDITEHLKLQQAERARDAAEAANRSKSEFLSRVSHELRTPLNAVLGFAQLLELDQDRPLSDRQRSWTTQIQQAGWHLLHMINDTLDLSRVEAGTLRLEPRALAVAPLVDAARSMIEPLAVQRGITVGVEVEPGLAIVGDDTRVKQILTNLLSNAVKYNVPRGKVDVVARTAGSREVEIAVSDTGPGLTPQQVGELFQPFNRLGREHGEIEGTGIGLVISRRLAELMGGTLRARSTVGVGSSFVLTLPRSSDGAGAEATAAPPEPAATSAERRHVLYIEDNATNAEVMRGILLQRPHVELEVAGTAADGMAALRARRPDLVLLDMHLPDLDGLELLRQLKADPALASLPVVVVSADALQSSTRQALADGAEHYLTKPVDVPSLLRTLDDLLGPREG